MIKVLSCAGVALLLSGSAAMAGDTYVHGYYRNDGTYVQGYHRTSPDSTPYNNYSTQGNYNPWTGKPGTVNPAGETQGSAYGSAQPVPHVQLDTGSN